MRRSYPVWLTKRGYYFYTPFPAITSRGSFYGNSGNWFAYCELYVPLEVAGLETYFEFH